MSSKPVDIVMSYYEDGKGIRTHYASQALLSLNLELCYSGRLDFIIADDSEYEQTQVEVAVRNAKIIAPARGLVVTVASNHNGIGASLNKALGHVKDVWMYTTDDWVLTRELNLDKAVRLLDTYDLVRLGPLHPNLKCITKFQQGLGWWLEVSETNNGFAFATRPFVARLEMFNQIGRFKEGVNSYECERDYAERVGRSHARIAMLLSDGTEWEHIGNYEVGHRDIVHA